VNDDHDICYSKSLRGANNQHFHEHSRELKKELKKNIKILNILPPNILTLTSDYVPEIIKFIEQRIQNGVAYV